MPYLDHAATTPLRPGAFDAMRPWLVDEVGNPSGAHGAARRARRAIDDARDVFAELVGGAPGEVIFTSGGTEADNLAIDGVLGADGGLAICAATEHHAVLHCVERRGGVVVPVDRSGAVDLDALDRSLAAADAGARIVVSVMAVNNETGRIADLASVVATVRNRRPTAVVHCDAIQAPTWIDVAAHTMAVGVDAVSVSGHKFGGPAGIGALVVRPGLAIAPVHVGGSQERGRRAGTPAVAAIVGAAAAASEAMADRQATVDATSRRRARLRVAIADAHPDVVETVLDGRSDDTEAVAAGHLHLCIPGVDAETLLLLLDDRGVAASAASSCQSGAAQTSHVLAAMGVDETLAQGSLRLSLGASTTDADVDAAIPAILAALDRVALFR